MQPWEFGSLPKAWLPALHEVDEIWAYSRSTRDCYLEAGVPESRVRVIPLGVDPEVFKPGQAPLVLAPGPSFRFLFVGGTIFRKGIDVLLAAFERAVQPGDDVGLVIKDMGSKSFYRGQTAETKVAALRERGYSVEYIDRNLDELDMARLYAACDCLVHPFRGEGFALPIVEAMACGLPVIVTGAGPVLDYASEETAFLIPARRGNFAELRVGDLETIGRPWLWEPDLDALVDHMRTAAREPAAARLKGSAASGWIRERFTWAHSAEAIERRLRQLVSGGEWQAPQPPPDCRPSLREGIPHLLGGGLPAPEGSSPVPGRREGASGEVLEAPPMLGPQVSTGLLGARETNGRSTTPVEWEAYARGPDVRLKPDLLRARVSLTMIVRDEENNLGRCLESVRDLFNEVVVLDTGSRDRTIEIARSFGARVFDFVWVDDFAAARNAALARAKGDYAFWLDADDLIEPPQRAKLEGLLGRLHAGGPTPAFVVRCACDPGPDGSGGDTVVDHIRLFPLIEGVRWTYRVHEQILPALKRAGVPVEWTDITVRHTGYVDRALRFRKLDRDCRILREELVERPDDPFTLFNLGSIAIEKSEWNEALGYLKRSLAGSAPTDSIVRKLYALIARSHQMLRDYPAALSSCTEGLSLDPEDAELWFRKAVVHRSSGRPADAEYCWRRILTLSRPRKFASLDQGIYGHLTRRNLAALAMERGDTEEARCQWRAVLEECPGDTEAAKRLGM